jgi:hypothetical protein
LSLSVSPSFSTYYFHISLYYVIFISLCALSILILKNIYKFHHIK